ncbi:MAG: hypothetical protein EXS64_06215 [Candidatus Latescibacteria bacterium]|nr:hypothetical protein [Candidatus Latescibacterota bacterium]
MRRWKWSVSCLCFILTALLSSGAAGEVPTLSADQIRPGMVGFGKTVFRGTKIDTFGVEIVDVMRNVFGPKEDLILARLSGGPLPLEKTGVIQGMSGSPVYVDGKLIGAVSYALTLFSKESLCGITPISEMLNALNRVTEDQPLPPGQNRLGRIRGDRSPEPRLTSPYEPGGSAIRPLAVPLAAGGFAPGAVEQLRADLSPYGFLPVQGVGGTDTTLAPGALEPGAAVGVQLVRGDLSLAGIGTLTYRDANRVVAFGHPMFSGGRSSFPMSSAYIYSVVASQYISFKLGAASAVQGSIVEDRAAGIVGVVGRDASMIPVAVTIRSDAGTRDYRFEVIRHPDLTPILTRGTLLSALISAEKQSGDVTTRTRSVIRMEGYPDLRLENTYSGAQALGLTILDLVKPLDAVMDNPFLSAPVKEVRFEIALEESLRTASVEGLRLFKGRFHPGDTIPFEVRLRPFHGDEQVVSGQVTLPPYVPAGPLALRTGSAQTLEKLEVKRAPGRYSPRDFAHLLGLISQEERNDDLVVEVLSQERGVTVGGEELTAPPSSVLSILRMSRQTGATDRVEGVVLARVHIRTAFVLAGGQQTTVMVEPE